jgi:hypothetical protein
MKNLSMVGFLALALALGACSQKGSSGAKAMRGTTGAGGVTGLANVGPTAGQNPGYWGNVAFQANDDQIVQDFLSSGQVQMGNVTNSGCVTALGQQCQIDFNISINPGGSPPNYNPLQLVQTSQTQFQTTGSGVLTVAVYDSLTGSQQNGVQLSAIGAPAVLQSAQMYYTGGGGSAYLVFTNNAGTITMGDPTLSQQNITGQSFTGQISFQYSGMQETLGSFSTSICYVFQCQGQ